MRSFPVGFTSIPEGEPRSVYPGDTIKAGGIANVLASEQRFLVVADPQGESVQVTFNATLVGELLPDEREELCNSLETLAAMIRSYRFE